MDSSKSGLFFLCGNPSVLPIEKSMNELGFQLSLMHLNHSTTLEEVAVVREIDHLEESLKAMEQLAAVNPS